MRGISIFAPPYALEQDLTFWHQACDFHYAGCEVQAYLPYALPAVTSSALFWTNGIHSGGINSAGCFYYRLCLFFEHRQQIQCWRRFYEFSKGYPQGRQHIAGVTLPLGQPKFGQSSAGDELQAAPAASRCHTPPAMRAAQTVRCGFVLRQPRLLHDTQPASARFCRIKQFLSKNGVDFIEQFLLGIA